MKRTIPLPKPDVPHLLKLPNKRVIYVEVPGHMTDMRDGQTVFLPAAMEFLDKVQAMAMKIESVPRPAQIAALRAALQMTQSSFAKALEVNKLTVSRWERGRLKPGAGPVKRMRELQDAAAKRGVMVA